MKIPPVRSWQFRPVSGSVPVIVLAAFVAGVFVGAGLWFPLLAIGAAWLWWHCCRTKPPSPPDLPSLRDG